MSQNVEYIAAQSRGMRSIMQGITDISPSPGCRARKLGAREGVLAHAARDKDI